MGKQWLFSGAKFYAAPFGLVILEGFVAELLTVQSDGLLPTYGSRDKIVSGDIRALCSLATKKLREQIYI